LERLQQHNIYEKREIFAPLLEFWSGVARFSDLDRYILPRFQRLEQSACALESLGNVLRSICKRSWQELPAVFLKAIKALIARAHTQERSRAAFAIDTLRPINKHVGIAPYNTISFPSGGTASEEHMWMISRILSATHYASSKVRNDSHDLWLDAITQLLEVSDAWDSYIGCTTELESGVLLPLQMQISQTEFHTHRLSLLTSLTTRWPRRTLRLLCLEPKPLKTGLIIRPLPFKVTASFDISSQCSHAIGDLVIDDLSPCGDFEESMGQERCKQLILDDIWEDPDEQLDAWQRLYVRACVRKWFKYLWMRRAKAISSG
jgi:hypothetical protein